MRHEATRPLQANIPTEFDLVGRRAEEQIVWEKYLMFLERRLRDGTEVTVGSGRDLTRVDADGEEIHAGGPMTSL